MEERIILGLDRPRTFEINLLTMLRFEEVAGRPLEAFLGDLEELLRAGGTPSSYMREFTIFLWAGLEGGGQVEDLKDEHISYIQLAKMLGMERIKTISDDIRRAMIKAVPDIPEENRKSRGKSRGPRS